MDGTAPSQLQLLDGQGNFDEAGLVSFAKNVNLAECGLSYAVVSIMGPQSSGKSTLLNHLFHTKFTEMDAFKRRGQTTQGVWLAQAVGVDPCTLVMDLEGTDGRERGEIFSVVIALKNRIKDDTTFEKQSALFALAVSDVMLINMWCHDIGREQAANKPLLKTIFQVMMRLFTPRKSTLLFVIRDKTKTPLEILEPILREDVQKIWDSVPKPEKHKNTPLSDFFNVDITDLPSFEEKEEQFKEQVAQLRQRFFKSIVPGGLAGDRSDVVPGNGFPLSIHEIWKVIKENKDLDLPAHTVMVATVRCEEIAYETLRSLKADKDWCSLEEEAQTGPISGFGKKLSILLDKYLSSYDAEANFFDASVRSSKRKILLEKALEVLFPSYQAVLGHYRSKAFNSLKQELESGLASGELFAACVERCTQACLAEFDYGSEDAHVEIAGWDATKTRDKLRRDVDAHLCAVKAEKLSELSAKYEKRLEAALIDPVASLLDAGTPDTWQAIRKLLALETEAAKSDMAPILAGYELDKDEETAMLNKLHETGRVIVEKKAKDEATQALSRMKDRFSSVFSHDADSMPRIWSGKEDMRTIIRDSRLAVLKLISTLAVLRLEERKTDKIESVLTSALLDSSEASADKGTSAQRSLAVSVNLLASSSWQGIPAKETLITPVQCKNLWRQFRSETEYTISQALAAQEASKRSSSWLPPPWAIAALLVLGFNEFMTLLRNPIYLAVIFVAWLLGKAIWVQLDIAKEFQVGFVPGVLSLSARFLPTIMGILKKLAEEGQKMGNNGGPANNTANHGNYTANGQYKPVPLQDMASYTSGSSSEVLSTNGEEYSSPARERQPQHPMYS